MALGIGRRVGDRYLCFEARSDLLGTPPRLDRLGHRLQQPPHILPISADRLVAGKRRQFGPLEEMDRTVVARQTLLPHFLARKPEARRGLSHHRRYTHGHQSTKDRHVGTGCVSYVRSVLSSWS